MAQESECGGLGAGIEIESSGIRRELGSRQTSSAAGAWAARLGESFSDSWASVECWQGAVRGDRAKRATPAVGAAIRITSREP